MINPKIQILADKLVFSLHFDCSPALQRDVREIIDRDQKRLELKDEKYEEFLAKNRSEDEIK